MFFSYYKFNKLDSRSSNSCKVVDNEKKSPNCNSSIENVILKCIN